MHEDTYVFVACEMHTVDTLIAKSIRMRASLYFRDHWDHIRAELDTVNYCDIKLDSRSGTTAR
jgi:hypothetical protein